MAPMTDIELKEYLKKAEQKKKSESTFSTVMQTSLSGVTTKKRKNEALKAGANKSPQPKKVAPKSSTTRQSSPKTPLVVEPLTTILPPVPPTAARPSDQVVEDQASWTPILKSLEAEFLKLDDARKKQQEEMDKLKKRNAELETYSSKIKALQDEIVDLMKSVETEKTSRVQRETELLADKEKILSDKEKALRDLELERGVSQSLREEIANNTKEKSELQSEIEGLKMEAALQHHAGFEKAIDQVRFLYSELDLSKASLFKVVRNNELIEIGDVNAEDMAVDEAVEDENTGSLSIVSPPQPSFLLHMAKRKRGKTRPEKKVLDTYTISGTNEIVRARDCVLIRPKKRNQRPSVVRVEKIEQLDGSNVEIRVRWFYRPEETVMSPVKFIGAKELFYSDHCVEVSADTIEGKCAIHSFKNYTKLETVKDEDYYCRFKYDVSTGCLVPENVTVYCKCEAPRNPDEFMIECQWCYERYHPACIDMTIEDAMKAEHFVCSECLLKKS